MWYRMLIPGARWRIPAITGKSIYLTFDDGPIPEVTPWVLDQLDELGVKATFFCVADNVRRYPELFAEIRWGTIPTTISKASSIPLSPI